jgi:SAM-dependent methyltransferase
MNRLDFASFNWLPLKINNESLARHLRLLGGIVIDLGCGTSPYKDDILQVATRYIGVDWQHGVHDQRNVDVFADLTQRLPFEEAYADTVVAFQVMEHLPEPAFFLAECFRILKPGGRLLVTVPFMWLVHEAPRDFYRYTRYGLEYLLAQQRFTEIAVEEVSGYWQTAALKLNYHTARLARGPLKYLLVPFWFTTQTVAPWLDKLDWNPDETAGYTVVARKPA